MPKLQSKQNNRPVEIPEIKDYLTETQRDGSELCAADVFLETMDYLRSCGCENVVSRQIVEEYAMSVARWTHIERLISKYGYIAKHPTTGEPMQSPYVTMSQMYLKQVIAIRAEINLALKNSRPTIKSSVREVVYGG